MESFGDWQIDQETAKKHAFALKWLRDREIKQSKESPHKYNGGISKGFPRLLSEEECRTMRSIRKENDLYCAQIAVKLYNEAQENKDKELELVDALRSNPIVDSYLMYHLNFTAKLKDGPDVETKRYFAELLYLGNDEHELAKICPVEPKAANSSAEITYRCWNCHPAAVLGIYHPDKEFMVGWQKLHKYCWSPSLTLHIPRSRFGGLLD